MADIPIQTADDALRTWSKGKGKTYTELPGIAKLDEDIAHMESMSATHIWTYQGRVEKSILIGEANADKAVLQAEIDKL